LAVSSGPDGAVANSDPFAAGPNASPGLWLSTNAGSTWQTVPLDGSLWSGVDPVTIDTATFVGRDPLVAGTVDGRLAVWTGRPQVPGA
jgi:hypothetical protein